VHEFGHFWVARLCGMKVDAFAVMMGGVRKGDDLQSRLPTPMMASSKVWAVVLGVGLATAVFGIEKWLIPYTIGLGILAIPIPIWIVSRIGKLYHLDLSKSLGTLVKCTLAAVALLFIGTRQLHSPQTVMGMMFYGGLLAIGLVYYYPVLNKPETSKQGEGELVIGPELVKVPFRPVASTVDRHGTEFSLLLLPLGGFASIHGMHPKEDGSEVNIPGGFYSKGAFRRLLVLFAGPLFSILFGILLMGIHTSVKGIPVENPAPIVHQIDFKSTKAQGLRAGDTIIGANGKRVSRISELKVALRGQTQQPIPILVQRDGATVPLTIVPELSKMELPIFDANGEPTSKMAKQYILGVKFRTVFRSASFSESLGGAVQAPIVMVANLAELVTKPRQAQENVGGVASMVAATEESARDGWFNLVRLAGLLSMSLGIMNLLPIHPLDGGQMAVATVELFRGKRLSMKTQSLISGVGMLLIAALTVFTLMADIGRFAGNK